MDSSYGFHHFPQQQQQQQQSFQVHPSQQYNSHNLIARGRQNQIPKRYEFQKNIPRRTSSQHNQQLLLSRIGVEEAKSPRSPLFPGPTSRENSVGSKGSQGSNLSFSTLARVKSTGPAAGGIAPTQNLAHFKRHSIADVGNLARSSSANVVNGKHGLNIYNDSTVFETTVAGFRNYAFEQQMLQQSQHEYVDEAMQQRKRIASVEISDGGRYNRQAAQAAHNPREFASHHTPRFLCSPRFNSRSTDNVDNTSSVHDWEDAAGPRGSRNSIFEDAKVENTIGSDDDVSVVDMDGLDEPFADDKKSNVTLNSGTLQDGPYDDSEAFLPTRTQQRKLAIKHELDGAADADNLPIGQEWLDPANYSGTVHTHFSSASSASTTSTTGPSSGSKSKRDTTAHWMNNSLKQRNMYEHVTSELRKMVLFNEKPLLESVTRNRKVQASWVAGPGDGRGGAAGAPRPKSVGALVEGMWQEARGRSLVG